MIRHASRIAPSSSRPPRSSPSSACCWRPRSRGRLVHAVGAAAAVRSWNRIEGPVAKIIAVIIIIVTGLTLAFGDTSGGFRRLIQIVFGLSIAFAASSFFLSFFSLRRRSAGLMGADDSAGSPASTRPGPSRADRADPARRRAARGRDPQRHARGRDRPRPAPLARRPRRSGLIGHVAAVWAAKRDPLSSTWCAGTCASRPSERVRLADDEPCRISPQPQPASPTSCPGQRWSGEGVVLNKDGSFQRTARFRGPDLDSATPAELVAIAGRLNNALRRLGSGWAIFVEAQRMRRQPIPRAAFPIRLRPGRRRAQGRVRGGGRALREQLFPDASSGCRRPRTPRAPRAGSTKAGATTASIRARRCAASSTAPTACSQLIEGFMPEADWLDDGETLTYLHSASRPSASACACPRRRCISTRSWPTSR